jgi:hypothetical protein
MRSIYLSLLALALVHSVSAALYPTIPTSATHFTAGRFETVTWEDDRFKPHLSSLGSVHIDLYTENNVRKFGRAHVQSMSRDSQVFFLQTYVTTLARNVNPTNLKCTLFISQDVLSSGSALYAYSSIPRSHSPASTPVTVFSFSNLWTLPCKYTQLRLLSQAVLGAPIPGHPAKRQQI